MSVMRFFPAQIRDVLTECGVAWQCITEIRLRAGSCCALTYHTGNKTERRPLQRLQLSEEDLRETLTRLCAGSVHAYDEGILRGYFSPQQLPGVRIGAAGRLLCSGGRPMRLQTLTSLCIRLPHPLALGEEQHRMLRNVLLGQIPIESSIPPECASPLVSTLFYAPPGYGKTTLLRCIIRTLCSCRYTHEPLCAAVLDDSEELCEDSIADCTVDRFCGYPRGLAMEIATRAFAPQVMICDEIGSEAEAEEILRAQACGVPLIATAHADSLQTLLRRPCFARLHAHGVFSRYVRLSRSASGTGFSYLCEVGP